MHRIAMVAFLVTARGRSRSRDDPQPEKMRFSSKARSRDRSAVAETKEENLHGSAVAETKENLCESVAAEKKRGRGRPPKKPEDVEMLEDLVLAAVVEAQKKARDYMEGEMKKATGGLPLGGMSLPGLF